MELHGCQGAGYKLSAYKHYSPYEVECTISVGVNRRARFFFGVTDHWRQIFLPHRSVCGAMLYVCLRRFNKTTPVVEDDKWEALTRIASLLPESDIELQHVGGHAVVSRRLSDGSLQPWGVAPLLVGEPLPRGREWSARFLPLLDQALTDAKSILRLEFDLLPRGTLLEDRARLKGAEARALTQGVPSTSVVRRVLCDVA